MYSQRLLRTTLSLAVLAAIAAPAHAGTTTATDDQAQARKRTTQVLEEIEVRGSREETASSLSPSQTDLDTMQPKSTVSLEWISNHTAPTSDYADIANITPGMSTVNVAGPGLGEAKQMTMRGFNDNQYNVTYDGIPLGDTNDFSHHSSSYFPAKMIGEVSVERGPGGASQLGEATFGGTIAIRSKDPRDAFSFTPTLSYGSYGTELYHFELNSGRLGDGPNSGRVIASAQYNATDTYRTDSQLHRRTTYFKYVQPVGDHTEITLLSNHNYIRFNNPDKTTLTQNQIDTLGRNFGLNNDPTSTDCACYNYQNKRTDVDYIGIDSALSERWHLSDKLYTYAYYNDSHEAPTIGTKASPTNMGGVDKVNNYRARGNVLTLSYDTASGQLRTGLWYERTDNDRYNIKLDYTTGGYDNPKNTTLNGLNNAYKYVMVDFLKMQQAFVEYEWRMTPALTVTPGIRTLQVTRDINAPINQTTRLPLNYSQTWNKTLGFLGANYAFTQNWHAYAQAAQGFLTPNLNQFYVPNPAENKTRPQETMNYQLGTAYQSGRLAADADVFYIDYKNYPLSAVDPVTKDPIFYLAQGATMRGAEVEGSFLIARGLSLFANASTIEARFKNSHLRIPNVPSATAAIGFNYQHAGFTASLHEKYSGGQYAYAGGFNPDIASSVTASAHSGGYWRAAMSLGYGQNLSGSWLKDWKIRLQVDNLFDAKQQVVDSVSGTTPYYLVLPTRSWFASVSFSI
ncbi:TonB-dependent receptor [Solilutibacter silvestris]|uniref:TonB dependent receptor n=1 Tax=Solilutibacter silvestris TaxID=1645665 RepID=A0A2K1PY62_9GAMM|nr:TonB-dependent receptor [Lysobacter silvestris]PNS07732.1 TonB dependent receptor [Lysobacter silvestris]